MSDFSTHAYGDLIAQGPVIMGIVNVTPDSFSDGGRYHNHNKAIEHALELLSQGAHILDIGGESTRPNAQPVDIKSEIGRVVPVIEGVVKHAPKMTRISIDTRNSETMKAALAAGCTDINDVSALTHCSDSLEVAASSGVPVFLMHKLGQPRDMQNNPSYNNVLSDVFDYLSARVKACEAAGIGRDKVIIDPGIGFGKKLEHNLSIIGNISQFHDIGVPVLLGASRKSFIEHSAGPSSADKRLGGSLAAALWALGQGVQMLRVHDVEETVQAVKIYQAISDASLDDCSGSL